METFDYVIEVPELEACGILASQLSDVGVLVTVRRYGAPYVEARRSTHTFHVTFPPARAGDRH